MTSGTTMARALSLLLLALSAAGAVAAEEGSPDESPRPDPAYVTGYATAALERADLLQPFRLEYEEETLRVYFAGRPAVPLDGLLRLLLSVDGVEVAEIHVRDARVARAEAAAVPGEAEPAARPSLDGYDVFLLNELFDPLLADPRWPRFSASHLWFFDDDELERVGAANFGETFVLLRSPRRDTGQWEIAFQAGVFSVFDLEASSSDLVNSDFWVGLNLTHHIGDFTWLVRVYHQSSHLGDEYLLRNRVDRVNLSFEVIDALVSFDPFEWLRLYGGGGVIVHREPAIERGIVQTGIELTSPRAFVNGYVRPLAGFDLQLREESDWKADASVRAGVQIEHPFLRRSRLHVLGEFYTGRSPNGQFYERRIKTLGLGIHLGF